MSIKPVTVTQLSTYLKQIFDAEELLHNISVVGEISGWSNVRGTAYFTLKDEGSALSCVCFTADEFSDIKNGDSVIVIGTPRYYVKGGRLNFNVSKIEKYGQSVLFQQYLELKAKLEKLGYFSEDIKKPMPKVINRIGVVSSEGGAVIQDIINIRTRRNPNIDIVLYPVKVQGNDAEKEIAHGIEVLDNYNVDVIVVARGGGSFEDLQPFNTEIVAAAIYKCKKPIVSAVGHETDYTIIDFCSDLRAPTPSAAAELLCENINDKKNILKKQSICLSNYMTKYLQTKKDKYIDNKTLLCESIKYIIDDVKSVLNLSLSNFNKYSIMYLDNKENKLKQTKRILEKLNPIEILKLGYATIKNGNKCISSVSSVKLDDDLDLQLKDGVIKAKVIKVGDIV